MSNPQRSVVLGVSGSIAGYKVVDLLRRLHQAGHDVRVVPTDAALRFVGAATWAALSGNPVTTQTWENVHETPHVRIGQRADLVVIAPATVSFLATAAHGIGQDLLTNILLSASCPVVFAPATHTEMWSKPTNLENVAALRRHGSIVLEPGVGKLTKDVGKGRLPDAAEIFDVCSYLLERQAVPLRDMDGIRLLVVAGGARDMIDDSRFIGYREPAKDAFAYARIAAMRGADVTMVVANSSRPVPAGVFLTPVQTSAEVREACRAAMPGMDAVVMAAQLSDLESEAQPGPGSLSWFIEDLKAISTSAAFAAVHDSADRYEELVKDRSIDLVVADGAELFERRTDARVSLEQLTLNLGAERVLDAIRTEVLARRTDQPATSTTAPS